MYIYKWFRKLNQNLRTIIATILIVAFFVILLQASFSVIRSNKERQIQELMNQQNVQNNNQTIGGNSSDTNTMSNTQSNINFSSGTDNLSSKQEDVLRDFVQYCNNNQIEDAYNIISDDCKKEIFPNIEIFKTNYINKIFNQKKTVKMERSMYGTRVYKITYYADLLANGGYQQSNTIQDYVYFIEKDGESKISISNFIKSEEFNKSTKIDSIYINVIKKNVYIDYEIYQIQITNQRDQTILLDSLEEKESVIILDDNEVKYPSNIAEQTKERLTIKPQQTTILDIKFNKMYNEERKDANMIQFLDIVTNYEQYMQGEEKQKTEIGIILK